MKKIFFTIILGIMILSSSTYAASSDATSESSMIDKKTHIMGAVISGTTGSIYIATAKNVLGEVSSAIINGGAEAVVVPSLILVLPSAIGGYLIGSSIVEADQAYFKGALISKTGEFLGPINRRIYNIINKDKLPEFQK